jgi:hypothetical protein
MRDQKSETGGSHPHPLPLSRRARGAEEAAPHPAPLLEGKEDRFASHSPLPAPRCLRTRGLGRVALGGCPPKAPTDPDVPALEHPVPRVMVSLRYV